MKSFTREMKQPTDEVTTEILSGSEGIISKQYRSDKNNLISFKLIV
jgi:hypothetical protein